MTVVLQKLHCPQAMFYKGKLFPFSQNGDVEAFKLLVDGARDVCSVRHGMTHIQNDYFAFSIAHIYPNVYSYK